MEQEVLVRSPSQPVEMETPSCPICGSAPPASVLIEAEDLWFGHPGRFTYRRCPGCSFVYLCPRPTERGIVPFYAHYYDENATEALQGGGLYQTFRRFWTGECLRWIRRHYPLEPQSVLLDVGCGNGEFLDYALRIRPFRAMGVDRDERAVAHACELRGLDCRVGTLREAALPAESVDVVTMFHVLEHFHDPVGELREVRRVLKPGGIVFLETPCFGWVPRLFGRHWLTLLAPTHLSHFDRRTLGLALEAAGLEPVKIRPVYTPSELMMSVYFALGGRDLAERMVHFGKRSRPAQALVLGGLGLGLVLEVPFLMLAEAFLGGGRALSVGRKPRPG